MYPKTKLPGRIRNIIDHEISPIIYKTLILQNFDYCQFLMVNISQQDAVSIQKLQNCAFWNLLGVARLTTRTYDTLNMDALHDGHTKHAATQDYKCPTTWHHSDAMQCFNTYMITLTMLPDNQHICNS